MQQFLKMTILYLFKIQIKGKTICFSFFGETHLGPLSSEPSRQGLFREMADAGEKSRPRDWWADNDVTKVAPIRPKRFFRRPWSIFLLLKNRSDSSTKFFLMIRSRKRRHRSFVKKMTNNRKKYIPCLQLLQLAV